MGVRLELFLSAESKARTTKEQAHIGGSLYIGTNEHANIGGSLYIGTNEQANIGMSVRLWPVYIIESAHTSYNMALIL